MMLVLCDEATRKVWVLFGKRRDFYRLFIEWKNTVELESGFKVTVVRTDNAPEFKAAAAALAPMGLQWEFTSPYFQEQVGTPERLNRTLITLSRAMVIGACLPLKFWAEAAATACYIRNRTPVGPEGKTPEEAFSGVKPSVGHLRVWGCLAYTRVPVGIISRYTSGMPIRSQSGEPRAGSLGDRTRPGPSTTRTRGTLTQCECVTSCTEYVTAYASVIGTNSSALACVYIIY